MPKIPANGIQLFYEAQGAGEPLLLIAGFACDHSIWSPVLPSLASKYWVVSFDNRGVGQTTAPDSPYSLRQMADDATAFAHGSGGPGQGLGGRATSEELALSPIAVDHPLLAGNVVAAHARNLLGGADRLVKDSHARSLVALRAVDFAAIGSETIDIR